MQKKMRFYNKLYFRFFCIFGITSSVLVLLVGVVFFRLYSRNTIHEFREQLEIDAGEIADKVEEYSESGEKMVIQIIWMLLRHCLKVRM